MSSPDRPGWGWLVLCLPLSISIAFYTGSFGLELQPALLIPVLTGWLASRFGPRVLGFMLALGVLATLGASAFLTETLVVSVGMGGSLYVLACGTGLAFSRSPAGEGRQTVLSDRWRWLLWALPIALWPAVFAEWRAGRAVGALALEVDLAAMPIVAILVASLSWSRVRAALAANFRGTRRALAVAVVALLIVACFVRMAYEEPPYPIAFGGLVDGESLVIVLAFLLPAFGIVDWRLMAGLVVLFFASDPAVTRLIDVVRELVPGAPPAPNAPGAAFPLGEITVDAGSFRDPLGQGIVHGLCASFLAGAVAPFWRSRDPDLLDSRRTGALLTATLAVLFLALPVASTGIRGSAPIVLGGAAYLIGLVWRGRGVVVGPLIIQLCHLLSLTVFPPDRYVMATALQAVEIGVITFPFAYFGYLSNRYSIAAPDPGGMASARGGRA